MQDYSKNMKLLMFSINIRKNGTRSVHLVGDSSLLPLFLKIFGNMPLFWNYIGSYPCFETQFSKNQVSI